MYERDQMTTVNEDIKDRTIRHMVHLERFKKGQVNRILKVLDRDILPSMRRKIEARLEKIIERGTDTGAVTTFRLKQLEKELTKLSDRMVKDLRKELVVDMTGLSRSEIEWQVEVIKQELGFDLELVIPSPRAVAKITNDVPFAGLTLDQWFNTLSQATQRGVMSAVNRGIVEGETTEQIMRRIRGTSASNFTDGVWATTRRQAETITRSTVNHVSTQARMELFKENEDIIKGLQWVATLDSRTSVICAGLDGKVFKVDKGPRPPAHPNCRSTMTAVLKDWKSLGLTDLDASQRASINGQVPATTTYGEWLKGQPLGVQEEVLGVSKAKLFNQGNLDISRFTDSRLKPLTLKELSTVEKKAFNRANLDL